MSEVVELHDRERFEIHAYYCGIEREDDTKARIRAGVDHWTDIRPLSDDAAAAKIASDGIDILIDLNGYTRDARTAVFARRPAPIQANWYGFPGTMGTPYHHYVIADPHVVPEGHEIFFSEKVLRLPCYQPNDRKRRIASEPPQRADEGPARRRLRLLLPQRHAEDHAAGLHRWMKILAGVPGSVLWLLDSTSGNQRPPSPDGGSLGHRAAPHLLRAEAPQPAASRALQAGRSLPRHLPLWRAHHGVRCHVDGNAGADARGPGLRRARLRRPRARRRHGRARMPEP